MIKKIIVTIILSMCMSNAMAQIVNTTSQTCSGTVTSVMSYPTKCSNGAHAAFKMSTSGGKWICSTTDLMDSMVLIARNTNQIFNLRIVSEIYGDCEAIVHYKEAAYASF